MIENLPHELLWKIFNLENVNSMLSLRTVSNTFNNIATDVLFAQTDEDSIKRQKQLLEKATLDPNNLTIETDLILKILENPLVNMADRINALIVLANNHDTKLRLNDNEFTQLMSGLDEKKGGDIDETLESLSAMKNILTDEQIDQILKNIDNNIDTFMNRDLIKVKVWSIISSRLTKEQVNTVYKTMLESFKTSKYNGIHGYVVTFFINVIDKLDSQQINDIAEELKLLLYDDPNVRDSALSLLTTIRLKMSTDQINSYLELSESIIEAYQLLKEKGKTGVLEVDMAGCDEIVATALITISAILKYLNTDVINRIQSSLIQLIDSDNSEINLLAEQVLSQSIPKQSENQKHSLLKRALNANKSNDKEQRSTGLSIIKALLPHLNQYEKLNATIYLINCLGNKKFKFTESILTMLNTIVSDNIYIVDVEILFQHITPYLDNKDSQIVAQALNILVTLSLRLNDQQVNTIREKYIEKLKGDTSSDLLIQALTVVLSHSKKINHEFTSNLFDKIILESFSKFNYVPSFIVDFFKLLLPSLDKKQLEIFFDKTIENLKFERSNSLARNSNLSMLSKIIPILNDEQFNLFIKKLDGLSKKEWLYSYSYLRMLEIAEPRLSQSGINNLFEDIIKIANFANCKAHNKAVKLICKLVPKLSDQQINTYKAHLFSMLKSNSVYVSTQTQNIIAYLITSNKININDVIDAKHDAALLHLQWLERWHQKVMNSVKTQNIQNFHTKRYANHYANHASKYTHVMKELSSQQIAMMKQEQFLTKNSMFKRSSPVQNKKFTQIPEGQYVYKST